MKAFIKEVVSEDGRGSTKRVVLFVLLFAFLSVVYVDLFTKLSLSAGLEEKLYNAFNFSLAAVVGGNVITAIQKIKTNTNVNGEELKP